MFRSVIFTVCGEDMASLDPFSLLGVGMDKIPSTCNITVLVQA